jgi:hypothetical protein
MGSHFANLSEDSLIFRIKEIARRQEASAISQEKTNKVLAKALAELTIELRLAREQTKTLSILLVENKEKEISYKIRIGKLRNQLARARALNTMKRSFIRQIKDIMGVAQDPNERNEEAVRREIRPQISHAFDNPNHK